METENNLTGIVGNIPESFIPQTGISPYTGLISNIETQDKVETLLNTIDFVKEDTYYNIEKFRGCLKRCEKTHDFEFILNYVYFYRTIKGWKLGTCIRSMCVYLKYNKYIDFKKLSVQTVFNLFMRVKTDTCADASKCLNWRKLKQMIKFAGYPYDLTDFHIPESKNKIKPEQLLTKNEFDAIITELEKHQFGKGLEFKTFFYLIADTGCRTGEIFSICKSKLVKNKDELFEIVVDGKTGERNVLLYHSSKFLKKLIDLGWSKWTFSYDTFRRQLERVCKRLNIKKRIYNHLLRHCFGSYIAQDNTVSLEIKNNYCGWSPKSRTLETTYTHFSQRKVIDLMKPVLESNPLFA